MKLLIIWSISIAVILADDVAVQEFIKANNLFASAVYKNVLQNHRGNFLVSPLSAETILAFTQSGCKGETAEEIRNALHLPNDKEQIEFGIKNFQSQLKNNGDYLVHIVNKMYVKKKFSVKEEFRKVATEVYHAELEHIDFTKKAKAVKTINKWVKNQTNDKIRNIIDSHNLKTRTRLILINCLYFKADWSSPFLVFETSKRKFYKTVNDVTEVDMMHLSHYVDYYECSHLNAKFVELSFKGRDASMTIILPNEIEGLAALENQIERVFTPHNFSMHVVELVLPKFRIESRNNFKKILKNLGVSKAFDNDEADLSGIAGDKGDLTIDKIMQKTVIDVSENGVEAAAATYTMMFANGSAFINAKEFIANHPFIFYIKIKGAIAFVGRVTEPQQ